MFDAAEESFIELANLHAACLTAVKEYRKTYEVTLSEVPMEQIFEPLRNRHIELTGEDVAYDEVTKHVLNNLGPDCPACGKPLRSPVAAHCPECSWSEDV